MTSDGEAPDDLDPAAWLGPVLGEQVTFWRAQDPDPGTAAALDDLVRRSRTDEDARRELQDSFAGPLEFGTAGLRGRLGPGPGRMNRVVVGQAAAGLAAYLVDAGRGGGRVLIGYDARHGSAVFARDTAEILGAAGFGALLCDRPVPTPVVAFGIRHLGCVAAVVVTASHNPPQDNGYKVYLGDGCQIVPPVDAEIAERIAWVARHPLWDVPRSDAYGTVGAALVTAYVDRLATLVPEHAARSLRWVYTPLHGVGGAVVAAAVARAGFEPPEVVAAQAAPDPDFPSVGFPNPEEPGVLDLALDLGRRSGVDLVVANDPDADRCAVAVPGPTGWRRLTGDELGALLGDDALGRGVVGTYAASVVSGSLLATVAAAAGRPFVRTLTGFKWIGRVPDLAFGYEEALGYCCDPAAVADKDGISALVRVLALAASLKAAGSSLLQRLDELERRHGVHATDQLAVRVDDVTTITAAMRRLRDAHPATLAGERVAYTDLADGADGLPPTDAVRLHGQRLSVVVRPSGTEPKLKCYLEYRRPPEPSVELSRARAEAQRRLDQVGTELRDLLEI